MWRNYYRLNSPSLNIFLHMMYSIVKHSNGDSTVENWSFSEKFQNIAKYAKNNFRNFSADSLANGQILKKFENNPWICETVLNYTVPMKDNPCLFTAWADRHFSDSFCWLLRIISATPVDAFAIGVSPEKIIIFINESCNQTKVL